MHYAKNLQSAENFLETLYRGSFTAAMPNPSSLPEEVRYAANLGLKLAPIPSHSRFVSAALARVGYPTFDCVQLRQWALEFPGCNWALATNNIAVFEYNAAIGRHALCELCGGDWDGWRDTLQFRSGETRFLLFRYSGQRLRILGPRFVGVRLHSADMVLVPPSRFFTGPRLVWVDKSATINVDLPEWMLAADDDNAGGNPLPAVPAHLLYTEEGCNRRYVYDNRPSL